VLCARPGGEVIATLGDQPEREVRAEAVDLGEILAKQFKKAPRGHRSPARFAFPCRRRRGDGNGPASRPRLMLSSFNHGFNPGVAGQMPCPWYTLYRASACSNAKQVLGAVVTGERLLDRPQH